MGTLMEFYGLYDIVSSWVEESFGEQELEGYWKHIGENCCSHVPQFLQDHGYDGLHEWFSPLAREEGFEHQLIIGSSEAVIDVIRCPHLDFSQQNPIRDKAPLGCRMDAAVLPLLAARGGFSLEITWGSPDRCCRWVFRKGGDDVPQ